VDSEDFKSFCRAASPSEVGSIPTRSRQHLSGAAAIADRRRSAVVAVVAAALLAAAPAVRAQAVAPSDSAAWRVPIAGVAAAPADSTRRGPRPFFVMMRSAIVPGWGQVYNRQPLKAVLVVAGEGLLTYKIFHELRLQNQAIDRQSAALEDSPEYVAALLDEQRHRNLKIDWIWWAAAAHLLQMADAYVDAHFRNFNAEFGTDETREGAIGAPRLSLAFRVRF